LIIPVSCLAFCVHKEKLTTPAEPFDHPYWDWVRSRIAGKVTEIRAQGFSGAAILSYFELEYGGIVAKMNKLEKIFTVKKYPPTNAKKLLTTYYSSRGWTSYLNIIQATVLFTSKFLLLL